MKKSKRELSTEAREETYNGKLALLATWEKQSSGKQYRNHAYLLKLRARVRNNRCYIAHRKDADAIL